jgi:hypothetical protein
LELRLAAHNEEIAAVGWGRNYRHFKFHELRVHPDKENVLRAWGLVWQFIVGRLEFNPPLPCASDTSERCYLKD